MNINEQLGWLTCDHSWHVMAGEPWVDVAVPNDDIINDLANDITVQARLIVCDACEALSVMVMLPVDPDLED